MRLFATFCFIIFSLFSSPAFSDDVLRIFKPLNESDPRFYTYGFVQDLCTAVMNATDDMGDYKIVWVQISPNTSPERVVRELGAGNRINVEIAVVGSGWEEKTIPVHVPVMKGLLGLRLFLVNADKLQLFRDVSSIDDLKKLKMGLCSSSWDFEQECKNKGFKTVAGNSYDGVFRMLCKNRFDYFPRGLVEIFSEYEKYKKKGSCIEIEPTLALRMDLPVYFYVSPKYPKLANRIRIGLERIMENGIYDDIFDQHFGSILARANLEERRIFDITAGN